MENIQANKAGKVDLFKISIDNVTLPEALERIAGFLVRPGKHYVTTPNVDHIVRMHKDKEFLEVYRKSSLILSDGMPVIWASRLLGRPIKERVAGSDLFLPLCELAAKHEYRIYFLGGAEGVAEKAAEVLKKRYPAIQIAGHSAPPFGFENDAAQNEKIVREINQVKPHLLFVALGAPKQEKWIARHIEKLDIKVAVCCGASVDFIAGVSKRAPVWMRKTGLEWFYRLASEPKRLWRRYLVEDRAFLGIVRDEWQRLRTEKPAPLSAEESLRSK